MSMSEDIVQVQPEEFPYLEKVLQEKLPASALIYNVLKLGQKVNAESKIAVKIYADKKRDQWNSESTFMGVANVIGLPQNLVVFCGPKEGPAKETILCLLSLLDWKRQNQFEGVDNAIAPVVIEEARKYGKVEEHDPICLYYMTKEFALDILQSDKDMEALSTPSLKICSLKPEDAAMVQDRWPEKREGYLHMLQASIELCNSGGVYVLKEGKNEDSMDLVSFAVQLPFGSIHALHTEPEHRRKGYGKRTMKILAYNIAKDGGIPLVQIYKTNDNSLSLNEGVGFKYSHDINLIHFTPH